MRKTIVSTALLLTALSASSVAQTCKYDSIKATAPAERFITQEDGTILDANTGLEWMACIYGMSYENGTCVGTARDMGSWSEALMLRDEVNGEEVAGYTDWRLPNVKELASIVEYACFGPAIDLSVFPETPSAPFWTNTPDADEINGGEIPARIIDFTYGTEDFTSTGEKTYVRFVRTP